MSRSFKKNPIVKDHDSGGFGKKQANRAVRRMKDTIPNGKSYRKAYCSYDIHDYISRMTFEESQKDFESDLKAYLNNGSKTDPREPSRFHRWYSKEEWFKMFKGK